MAPAVMWDLFSLVPGQPAAYQSRAKAGKKPEDIRLVSGRLVTISAWRFIEPGERFIPE